MTETKMYFYYFHLRFKFWWVNLFKGLFFLVGKKIVFTKWETLGTDCIASSHFSGRKNCINSRPKHGPLQRQWKRSEEWPLFLSVKICSFFGLIIRNMAGGTDPFIAALAAHQNWLITHIKRHKKSLKLFLASSNISGRFLFSKGA